VRLLASRGGHLSFPVRRERQRRTPGVDRAVPRNQGAVRRVRAGGARMTSPFKFLDAYDPADKNIFFGRSAEVDQLYTLIYQSDLLLVYGQSGTGKTSLIQCGLATRFKPNDRLELLVRRKDNLNASLAQEI